MPRGYEQEDALDNVRDMLSEYHTYGGAEAAAIYADMPVEEETRETTMPDGTAEGAIRFLHEQPSRLRQLLMDVRQLRRPPPRLLLPLRAAAVLLQVTFDDEDARDGGLFQMLKKNGFIEHLLDVKPDAVTSEQWAQLGDLTANADFTYVSQAQCSLFGAVLTAYFLDFLLKRPEGEH